MNQAIIRIIIFFASAALGLLAAGWLVSGFSLRPGGFILAVLVFAIAQSLLTPVARNLAQKNAPKLLGGIGLASTFVALLIASVFPGGIRISGVTGWLGGALVVWIVTALGAWALPMVLIKDKDDQKVTTAPASAAASAPAKTEAMPEPQTGTDPVEQLRRLAELHQQGLLTDSDFEAAKRPIIARMSGN